MFELWCLRFDVSGIETYQDNIRRGFEFANFLAEISLGFLWVVTVSSIGGDYHSLCENVGAEHEGGYAGFFVVRAPGRCHHHPLAPPFTSGGKEVLIIRARGRCYSEGGLRPALDEAKEPSPRPSPPKGRGRQIWLLDRKSVV